jgi:hypothetical protein
MVVIQKKRTSSVSIAHMKGNSEMFKHIGNYYNIKKIFKTKFILRSSLMKPDWKEICNRWHIVSIAFHLNVAETILAKQAVQLCELRHSQRRSCRKIKTGPICL